MRKIIEYPIVNKSEAYLLSKFGSIDSIIERLKSIELNKKVDHYLEPVTNTLIEVGDEIIMDTVSYGEVNIKIISEIILNSTNYGENYIYPVIIVYKDNNGKYNGFDIINENFIKTHF